VASRNWNRGADDFGELAYGYSSEREARNQFSSSPPEKLSPDILSDTRPYGVGVQAKGADQAEYICGEWEQGKCMTWWAWLRFGAVNVTLRYRHTPGDPKALSDEQLGVLVTNAVEDLAARSD
jgi:hypothetical protein